MRNKVVLALGTPVAYHHRAAVARWGPPENRPDNRYWRLLEGVSKNEQSPELEDLHDRIARAPAKEGRDRYNKTVMVWPQEGSGIIIGLVRRQKGISHGASGGGGLYGDSEPDLGYFYAWEQHNLYAVKAELSGVDYILVPTWAARPAALQ